MTDTSMTSDLVERWLPAPGFEGLYAVSSLGRVRNERSGRMLQGSQPRNTREYPCVNFRVGGQANRMSIHRLVAIAFLGYPPNSAYQVRHKDGDHMNPAAINLCWGTVQDNADDRKRHGRNAEGARHGCAKLSELEVQYIRIDQRPTAVVAAEYGVHRTTVQRIRNGRRWSALKARARQSDREG